MYGHTPVLLGEVLEVLHPEPGNRYLDVTVGLGGHAREILDRIRPDGSAVLIDTDASNLDRARQTLASSNPQCIHANFGGLPECLPQPLRSFDLILADLGISSPHLDDAARGFSFRADAPLDMRLDQSSGLPASHVLAATDRITLIEMFRDFGEIKGAHKLVDAIIARRKSDPVRTTRQLADVVRAVYGRVGDSLLPQVFQAIRMTVNDELGSLRVLLTEAPSLLASGGRFAVITFHSLEDRMVKNAFRDLAAPEKDVLTGSVLKESEYRLLTPRSISPESDEVSRNPRARSARLRAIQRKEAYTALRT